MSSSDHSQRVLAKRQHRILALYLAVGAWSNNLDAIVLERATFTRFLSLERVKRVRIKQFQEDVREWFPFTKPFFSKGDSLHSIYLSRTCLEAAIPKGSMNTSERVKALRLKNVAIKEWSQIDKDIQRVNEHEVVSFVALLASGLTIPTRGDYSVTLGEKLERVRSARLNPTP
jgi:hypothetical protein